MISPHYFGADYYGLKTNLMIDLATTHSCFKTNKERIYIERLPTTLLHVCKCRKANILTLLRTTTMWLINIVQGRDCLLDEACSCRKLTISSSTIHKQLLPFVGTLCKVTKA